MGAQGIEKKLRESEVPVTHRQAAARDLPAGWLDRLLVATCELLPQAPVKDAARAILDAASSLLAASGALGDSAVGVCIASAGGQVVVRAAPRQAGGTPDPTRLFPEFAFERVVHLDVADGSTLHLASDDPLRFSPGSAMEGFVDRLAMTLASAIRNARAFERSARQSAEYEELQSHMIQAEKLASLGQIAAGIVHELNNPLTSIVAYSDYLRRKAEKGGGDPADVERLSRIHEAAERILRFSRDLTAYSRPAAEVPAPVEIHEVIDRALVFCEHVLDETRVTVEKTFGEVLPVRGVAGQLTQVFVNLFTNAAHAMRDDGGSLRIATRMHGEREVTVTIRDEGHGIDEDNLQKIFEPFFTTKTDGTGTGLGLSIVRNIVHSHGGRIRADVASPKGTVFSVSLPVAAIPRG